MEIKDIIARLEDDQIIALAYCKNDEDIRRFNRRENLNLSEEQLALLSLKVSEINSRLCEKNSAAYKSMNMRERSQNLMALKDK